MEITKKSSMPDLSTHNEPITVGMAISELLKCGISTEKIRFNIVNQHPTLGEIVSQDPAPGVSLSLVDEVSLDVNSWSENNGRRFSFFEAEELLQAEQNFDEWQMEDWAEYKNFIVHVFARLDNIGELSHDNLLEKYILTQVIPVQLDGFRRLNKMNVAIKKEDLLDPAQWKMLCGDLRKAAVATITSKGFACIIAKYLRLDTDKIACKFGDDKWVLKITKDKESESDILRVKWLDYLFRPLEIQVVYKWKRHHNILKPDLLSFCKNLLAGLARKWKIWLALFMSALVVVAVWKLNGVFPELKPILTPIEKTPFKESKPPKSETELKIEFASDSHYIGPKFRHIVKEVADYMKSNSDEKVVIEGHTDNFGPRDHNINLSIRRAESVKNYLIKKFGISPHRITTIGYGPDRPISYGNTPEVNEKNRRVVVKFVE